VLIGIVKFFNSERGYGFITPDDGSAEMFVHIRDLHDAGLNMLQQGDAVAYEIGLNVRNQRPKAVALRLLHVAERDR
jgi:cold shock protein